MRLDKKIKEILHKGYRACEQFVDSVSPPRYFFAPGRVNLIGEHVDYNGGKVLPCALNRGTYAITTRRSDDLVVISSINEPPAPPIVFSLAEATKLLPLAYANKWGNYVLGVFKVLADAGYLCANNNLSTNNHSASSTHHSTLCAPPFTSNQTTKMSGLNICYYGNLARGAGLSSSASIEVLTAYILNDYYQLCLDRISIAKYAQAAENSFVGVNCGIMDQFVVANAVQGNALLLDCATLDYTHVPLAMALDVPLKNAHGSLQKHVTDKIVNNMSNQENYTLVIANTNWPRSLANSKYNERHAECQEVLGALRKHGVSIDHLADLSSVELASQQTMLIKELSEKHYRRARHVVTEVKRTNDAVQALKIGNIAYFGELMNASHTSLCLDYEVSGEQLDCMVSYAKQHKACIGSRMTGAGFGGCTISLVQSAANGNQLNSANSVHASNDADDQLVGSFIDYVSNKYYQQMQIMPEFYQVKVSGGATEVQCMHEGIVVNKSCP